MKGVNDYVSQAHQETVTNLNLQIKRLEYRIENAREYLKNRAYPESAINLAEQELSLAMSGK